MSSNRNRFSEASGEKGSGSLRRDYLALNGDCPRLAPSSPGRRRP